MKKETKRWKTKHGEKIRICDMEDSHLINTIKLLHRFIEHKASNLILEGYSCLSFVTGEMAMESIENGLDELEREGLDPYEEIPILENLENDAKRRGLNEKG